MNLHLTWRFFRLLNFALFLMIASLDASADDQGEWIISDDILIKTPDGADLSVLVVRPATNIPLPVALNFTIYAKQDRMKDIEKAIFAARKGYVGVIGYARGKHLSNSKPRPYETEFRDVNVVIDWLSRQPWTDGRVAMYGGSYDGFAQWAAAKYIHKALKTMVPYVAAIPGVGLPMENGIFLNANYGWPFYVTNNRYTDNSIYEQQSRWNKLNEEWFKSGKSYRSIDRFDKRANYLLHTWLNHPDYDAYWQAMVPIKEEYASINIPVLSVTGYFDDGQVSALRYLQQHEQYNHSANHYLVIGPYDHWTAQRKPTEQLRDIRIDEVAMIDVRELTFEWFDHVMKGAAKPALLKNKINYQVMGTNRWASAPSLHHLNQLKKRLYFAANGHLSRESSRKVTSFGLEVDLTDRETENDYYPWPIISEQLNSDNGLTFESEVLDQDMVYAGQFSANLDIRLDRKDVDLNVVVYERTKDNRYVHISYYLGRASYTADIAQRQLLTPGQSTSIAVSGTRMNGTLISKGSKIVVVLSVNKNAFAQVNYGSGKEVSEESVDDAVKPISLELRNTSYIDIPLKPLQR